MSDPGVERIIDQLGSREPQEAWTQFLGAYSPIIFQVVQLFERDPDHRSDCFLYVCERLSREQFRRLRRFSPAGRASFNTWLRVVVRNLCLDWHRKEFGRHRVFQAIASLPALDQDVFHSAYVQGLSKEDCFVHLLPRYPRLERAQVETSLDRIQQALTPRQLWLLSTRSPRVESLEGERGDDRLAPQQDTPDPGPGPETLFALKEQRAALERGLAKLPKQELLLIRLRYDQGLTLNEVAALVGLKDAQTADRRIREVLEKLRTELEPFSGGRGKTDAPSV
jgi:RNA polymerase sigma factor (sigma-70 family)